MSQAQMLPFKVNKRYWPKIRAGPKPWPKLDEKSIRKASYETMLAELRKDRNAAKSDFDLKVDRKLLKIVNYRMAEVKKEIAAEERKKKAEERERKAEVRKKKAEERERKAEERKKKAEERKKNAEERKKNAGEQKQKAEDRKRKANIAEVRKQPARTVKKAKVQNQQ